IITYIDENNFQIDVTFISSESGKVCLEPTLINQTSAFSEFSDSINVIIDDNFDNHNDVAVLMTNGQNSIASLKYSIPTPQEIGVFDFFFTYNLRNDQQFSIQLLNNITTVVKIVFEGGIIYNYDGSNLTPIHIYDINSLTHFHIEFMKDSCFLYLNKKLCARLTILDEILINTIKFYANQGTSDLVMIGYLDALGVSWNTYNSFSNHNPGHLQSEGIESKDINVESSLAKILQVDALGDYKKPFGIIGKNWKIGETDVTNYGFDITGGAISTKIINSKQGHNRVLELVQVTSGSLPSLFLLLGSIDKLDYEIFINIHAIETGESIQIGGSYYVAEPPEQVPLNKIAIDYTGAIWYSDSDGVTQSTNYSVSFDKWNHFRIEWRKGVYFNVFLNGNKIISITEGVSVNSIEQFDIDLGKSEIYVDAIAFNTHTKNYGYNKFSNMSDGVGIFKGIHADRAIIKQVRTKIADVNSSGNFKIPAGILGKDWGVIDGFNNSGIYCGWEEITSGPVDNIVQSYKGHNYVMELQGHKTKYVIPYAAEILYDIHVFPQNAGAFEFGIQESDGTPVAKIILDSDGYVKFRTSNALIDTGLNYDELLDSDGNVDWIHFSVIWNNSQYLQIKVNGQTIVETIGATIPNNPLPEFEFVLDASGSTNPVYIDAVGLSCFGYHPYYNIEDGVMIPKGLISEKLQTEDAVIENANIKHLDNVTTLKVKQIQSQSESVFHFNSSDKVDYWAKKNPIYGAEFTDGSTNVLITCPSHGLNNGDEIRVIGTINYDGQHTITYIDENSFTIPDTYIIDENGTLYCHPMDITSYISYDEGNKTQITCNDHGFFEGEEIEIRENVSYDGFYFVSVIDTHNFVIDKIYAA
ncbi:MAG: hypothetical protein K8S14_05270, partial [Actinomycetia bacterium]|nr:hypothetical protein [Actinomycetes bacterium]